MPNIESLTAFNGAALFQVRKVVNQAMEASTATAFNGAALFQVRKDQVFSKMQEKAGVLQWGRTLSSAESISAGLSSGRQLCLQWGRTLSSAESAPAIRSELVARDPSMGPHSFKCGKMNGAERQWSGFNAFNGAALFQVRKANG